MIYNIHKSATRYRFLTISLGACTMLIQIFILLSFVRLVDCTTASRLDDDTRACKWKPNMLDSPRIYAAFERSLGQANIPKEDTKGLYEFTIHELLSWVENSFAPPDSVSMALVLSQLILTRDLDIRDCFDHCTFVLTKNNCNSAMYQHACQPLARRQHYIKSMLDSKVFTMIDRCQLPLMYHALYMNATEIDPNLYKTVEKIACHMTYLESHKWSKINDMIRSTTKPFIEIRKIIRPAQAGFLETIAAIMLELEKASGGDDLYRAIARRDLDWTDLKEYFFKLVMRPCLQYIDKMHTVMDATIFYGRIVDRDRHRFKSVRMNDALRVEYFKLAQIYEACTYLDNGVYIIDWRSKTKELIRGF